MEDYMSIFLAGLTNFVLAFCVFGAAPKILGLLSEQYGKLEPEKRVLADNTLMSGVITAFLGSLGSYVLFLEPEVYPTQLRYNCVLLKQGIAAGMAYILADTVMMIRHRHLASKTLLVHHAVGVVCQPTAIVSSCLPWLVSTWLLFEVSSPFVHLRLLLNILGEKKNRLYTVNSVVMTSLFFLCRVAIIPFYWGTVYTFYAQGSFPDIDRPGLYVILYGRIFFDVLNVIWFCKMMRYFVRKLVNPRDVVKEEKYQI
ncbi:TMEM56 [Branchiostoma lanceolatum]|uniref:TMEM56 protein n=1 Tax=Branchiostoma lanceolatum TaxID=7740 RepID=A0A8J9Z4A4_BRALA|nr:TMEM56 [Branchiostoma lanceolatum]